MTLIDVGLCFTVQHRIQLACPIDRIQIIAAADVLAVDKNLRYCSPTGGTFSHSYPGGSVSVDFIFDKGHAFPAQQRLCPDAVGAGLPGIDFDVGFDLLRRAMQQKVQQIVHGNFRGCSSAIDQQSHQGIDEAIVHQYLEVD